MEYVTANKDVIWRRSESCTVRIGICDNDGENRRQLAAWVRQYCTVCSVFPEVGEFTSADEMFNALALRRFDVVFLGVAGNDGFLAARRLRENDKNIKLVYIDDTGTYALMGVRLHFSDYIVRPLTFKSVVRALKLSGVAGEEKPYERGK